jgi:hypothetical protein
MADWHTPESARDQWVDAPLDDEQLQELLDVAKGAVLAYAPVLDDPETDIPTSYRVAQLTQTKNLWNGAYASPSGDLDGGSFGLTTFPLDWQVKQILRPRSVFGGPVG